MTIGIAIKAPNEKHNEKNNPLVTISPLDITFLGSYVELSLFKNSIFKFFCCHYENLYKNQSNTTPTNKIPANGGKNHQQL